MSRLKLVFCLIFFALSNSISAYDNPCPPPLSISRPYSVSTNPSLLHFAGHKFAFAIEMTAGEYSFSHLFPWPRGQGYLRFGCKNFGGFVAFLDRYQLTVREETKFTDSLGEYFASGYLWATFFVYSLRAGVSYLLHPNFIFGISGDVNYGVEKFDLDPPPEVEIELHEKHTGHSTSYSVGIAVMSHRKKILSMGYDSRIVVALDTLRYRYLIPHQISVSLRLPMSSVEVGINYYRRFSDYEFSPGQVGPIESNDYSFDLSVPTGANPQFYFAFYSLALTYFQDTSSGRGYGFCLGPKRLKTWILKDLLLIYETGNVKEFPWSWRFRRYGIRFGFSI